VKLRRIGCSLALVFTLAGGSFAALDAEETRNRTAGGDAAPGSEAAAEEPASPGIDPGYLAVRDLLSDERKTRRRAAETLVARGERGLVFGIVDALFFISKPFRGEAFDTLEALTGEKPGRSYWDWVELAGRLEDLAPSPGYSEWKATLFSHLDPGYRRLLDPAAPRVLRLEEVVSGGVRIEGIPSLDDPTLIAAGEAGYLRESEEVFGVFWNGEARAYPLRFLDWHEMLNDRVGGEPITLSYCTLCGAGVLFRTARKEGSPYRFATSGLLYRSNKLMFDRASETLWSNLTGEPVLGPLVGRVTPLPQMPFTRSTWGDWKKRHPQTLVVALDKKLRDLGFAHGFDYQPGRADRARRGVSFPVWKKSPALEPKDEIYALRSGQAVKAYPLERLLDAGLVNDALDGQPIVLLADRSSGAVRAYRRPEARLRLSESAQGDELIDPQGTRYRAGELALERVEEAPADEAADARTYERLPGHFAYWFGWYAFFPQTAIWQGSGEGSSPPG